MKAKTPTNKWANVWRALLDSVGLGISEPFDATQSGRTTADWTPTNRKADDEVRLGAVKLRARARELARNNPVIRNYLRLMLNNVLGHEGPKLYPMLRVGDTPDGDLDKERNDVAEAAWCEWCRRPTRDGVGTFLTFQRTALRQLAREGEAIVRMHRSFRRNPFGFAVELIDPDWLDTDLNTERRNGRQIVQGIEIDDDGRPVAYYFGEPLYSGRPVQRERVPAHEVIYVYDPERALQRRGFTWLASVMVTARQLGGYEDAHVIGARLAASKMGFFERDMALGADVEHTSAPEDEDAPEPTSVQDMEANPGTFNILPPGYKFNKFDVAFPHQSYSDFTKAGHRKEAVGLGVSYNALLSDLENVNYSSMRSGLLVERDEWRSIYTLWRDGLLCHIYENWLNMSLLVGAVDLGTRDVTRVSSHRWSARGWPWVDPLKDMQAAVLGIQNGLASRQQVLAEQGRDFEDVLEELAEEEKLAKTYKVKLGAPVPASAPPSGGGGTGAGQDAEDKVDDEEDGDAARATNTNGHHAHESRLDYLGPLS